MKRIQIAEGCSSSARSPATRNLVLTMIYLKLRFLKMRKLVFFHYRSHEI